MQGQPGRYYNTAYFNKEGPIHIVHVKVLFKQQNGHEINCSCGQLDEEHLEAVGVDLCVYIKQLNQNKGREGYGNNVHKGVVECYHGEHNDSGTLEHRFPNPNTERLEVEGAAFLECLVQRGELHDRLDVSISVKH